MPPKGDRKNGHKPATNPADFETPVKETPRAFIDPATAMDTPAIGLGNTFLAELPGNGGLQFPPLAHEFLVFSADDPSGAFPKAGLRDDEVARLRRITYQREAVYNLFVNHDRDTFFELAGAYGRDRYATEIAKAVGGGMIIGPSMGEGGGGRPYDSQRSLARKEPA